MGLRKKVLLNMCIYDMENIRIANNCEDTTLFDTGKGETKRNKQ